MAPRYPTNHGKDPCRDGFSSGSWLEWIDEQGPISFLPSIPTLSFVTLHLMVPLSIHSFRNSLLLGLMMLATGLMTPASATLYEGNLVEVIDEVLEAVQASDVGVDPAHIPYFLRKYVRMEIGENWQEDLKRELDLEGLSYTELPATGIHLVTLPSTKDLFLAIQALASGNTVEADRHLSAALELTPTNEQAVTLRDLLAHVVDWQARLGNQLQNYSQSINTRGSTDSVAQALQYHAAWEAFWGPAWSGYTRCSHAGLAAELEPILSMLSKQHENYVNVLTSVSQRTNAIEISDILEDSRSIDSLLSQTRARTQAMRGKSRNLAQQGIRSYKTGNAEDALQRLNQSFDLNPGHITTRGYLAALQTAARKQRREERARHASTPHERPNAKELKQRASELLEMYEKNGDAWAAWGLLHIVEQEGSALGMHNETTLRRLRIAASRTSPGRIGIVNGLVTGSNEFGGGETLPVSVSMDPRRNLTSHHEVVINDATEKVDRRMYKTIIQSLAWLDTYSGGILPHYRIALRFKNIDAIGRTDALDTAFAIAAFSSLYELDVPSDLSLAGGLHSYGGVFAVGSLQSMLRTARRDTKRILILPKENEVDLVLFEDAIFRDMHVYLAETMNEYLFAAFSGQAGKRSIWEEANTFYQVALNYERLGLLEEALANYQKALDVPATDYSCRRAVKRLTERGVKPFETEWTINLTRRALEREREKTVTLQVDPSQPSDQQQERLTAIATGMAQHANQRLAEDNFDKLGQQLLTCALLLHPADRTALLLKGKLLQQLPIDALSRRKIAPPEELADLMVEQAQLYKTATSPLGRSMGDILLNLVTSCIFSTHEEALIEMAAYRELHKREFNVQDALDSIPSRSLQAHQVGEDVQLVPKKVPIPDLASLPADRGLHWGKPIPSTYRNDDDEFNMDEDPFLQPEVGDFFVVNTTTDPFDEMTEIPDPDLTDIEPATSPTSSGDLRFSSRIVNVKQAMNGERLVVQTYGVAKAYIVDVPRRRQLGTLPSPSPRFLYACGDDILLIYDPDAYQFLKYSVKRGRLLDRSTLNLEGTVIAMEMGSANPERALLRVAEGAHPSDSASYAIFDVASMRASWLGMQNKHNRYGDYEHIRMSPNGQHFTAWRTNGRTQGAVFAHLDPENSDAYLYAALNPGYILPVGDRPLAACGNGDLLDADLNIVDRLERPIIPDISGEYYLCRAEVGLLELFRSETKEFLGGISIPGLTIPGRMADQMIEHDFTPDRSLLLDMKRRTLIEVLPDESILRFHTVRLPRNL